MDLTKNTYFKRSILSVFTLGFMFSGVPVFAQTLDIGGSPEVLVCDVLGSIGLGCGASRPVDRSGADVERPSSEINDASDSVGNSNSSSAENNAGSGILQASIANIAVKRTASEDEVILIKASSNSDIRETIGLNTGEAIFEIIKGQKHFIPTVDIFFDYGFDLSAVQNVTRNELNRFPRTKLVSVKGDKNKIYYITEGGMVRLIPNDDVFKSYGNRKEDVVVISKKEFNFYPRNQYVYLENPLTYDIFQISDSGIKRYVVPQVVRQLRITADQIAPINKAQFDAYEYGSPIIF